MEFIEGWPMSRLDEARAAGVDTRSLAVVGANAFMRQVLVEGRYHADLHHANLLVTPDERVAYLDFGMVGELADRERREVARLLAALVFGDADAALVHTERLGVRIPADRLPALRSGLDALMGRTLESGGSDLAAFGLGLLKLLRDAGVSVPSGYTLLVKALVTVEGVSRELYPEIDMIATAAPFATEVVLREGLDAETLRRRMPAALRAAVRALLAEG
jgi:ubiquinone biosynthesis protein